MILDTGELPADPRAGMVVNEFAQLLEAEVRRVNDPGLWVLMSNGPLEVPHVSRSASRSAFGYFVTEGLAGAADRDGDGVVELHEPVEYVRQGVAGWVDRESSGAETQTPWLLHGGEGSANAPAGLGCCPVSDFGRRGTGDREGQVPRTAADNPAKPEQAAAAPRQAATQLAALFEEAWRLRDRIEQSSAAARPTPIDYAPHLWRAYQELLLGYESRWRGGRQYDPAQLADDLRTDILPLKAWRPASRCHPPPVAPRSSTAWPTPNVVSWPASRRSSPTSLPRTRGPAGTWSWSAQNVLVFRATDYVRWLAAAQRGSWRRHRLAQPIADLLAALRTFVNQLEALEIAASTPSGSNRVADAFGTLGLQMETLERLRKTIEDNGLYKDAGGLIDMAAKSPGAKGIAGPIDSLLATPLLPPPLRTRLLRREPVCNSRSPAKTCPTPAECRGRRWSAAATCWTTRSRSGAASHSGRSRRETAVAPRRRRAYRAVAARTVPRFRHGRRPVLPATAHCRQSGVPARQPGIGPALRAIAAGRGRPRCKADSRGRGFDRAAAPAVSTIGPVPTGYRWAQRRIALMANGRPTNVEIAVTATHRPPGAAQWMLTYNPDELAVALPGESAAVPPDKWVDFSLGQDAARLEYAVAAKALSGRENVADGERPQRRQD